jgi:hypothetical protein
MSRRGQNIRSSAVQHGEGGGLPQVKRHEGLGLCSACWQRRPERPFVQAAHLAARLADPPDWLDGFVVHLAVGHGLTRACTMITALGRLLEDEHPNHPQNLLEPPGGRAGRWVPWPAPWRTTSPARAWRCRPTRPNGSPPDAASAASMLSRPRTDHTVETTLAIVRDLARFLTGQRGKQDWALTDVHDIEAFLATLPKARKRRLTVLRQFFGFARTRKIILADPARGLTATAPVASPGRPSPLTSNAPCSAAGLPVLTLIRRRPPAQLSRRTPRDPGIITPQFVSPR